jgi:hypothetical protein
MATATAQLKRKLKYGPRMGRELSSEYLSHLTQSDAGPRQLSPHTIEKLRVELARLATSPDARVRRFVAAMAERYPGVCNEISH